VVARQLQRLLERSRAPVRGAQPVPETGERRDGGEVLEVALQIGARAAVAADRSRGAGAQLKGARREAASQGERAPALGLIGQGRQEFEPVALVGGEQRVSIAGPSLSALLNWVIGQCVR